MNAILRKAGPCTFFACSILTCGHMASAQDVDVKGRVELVNPSTKAKVSNASEAVVWLTDASAQPATAPINFVRPLDRLRLAQHNKSFEPHLLVVPVGAEVEFPNLDSFFHNVFSLFEGKRFDLGLYEAGSTRNVTFDRPGISYIFCNIHPEMSAVVIALETPYYALSNPRGEILISGVPSGRYMLHVWHESSLPETLNGLTREVKVSQGAPSFGVIRLTRTSLPQTHKNMFGRDYDPPTPSSPAYKRP